MRNFIYFSFLSFFFLPSAASAVMSAEIKEVHMFLVGYCQAMSNEPTGSTLHELRRVKLSDYFKDLIDGGDNLHALSVGESVALMELEEIGSENQPAFLDEKLNWCVERLDQIIARYRSHSCGYGRNRNAGADADKLLRSWEK